MVPSFALYVNPVQKNNTNSRIAVIHNPTLESAHVLHTEVELALQQRKPHEVVMSVLEGTKLDIKENSKVGTYVPEQVRGALDRSLADVLPCSYCESSLQLTTI